MGIQNSVLAAFGAFSSAVAAASKYAGEYGDLDKDSEGTETKTTSEKSSDEPSEKTKQLEDMKKKSRDSLMAARTIAERKRKIREAVLSHVARSEEEE